MTIPGLPDKPSKFYLLTGIVILALIINYSAVSVHDHDVRASAYNFKKIDLKYEKLLDSLECFEAIKKIDTINANISNNNASSMLLSEMEANKLFIVKKKLLDKKRQEIISILDSNEEIEDGNDNRSEYGEVFFIIIAFLAIVVGFVVWDDEEYESKHVLRKEAKSIPCQSCGMILKYDLHPFVDAEFCSHCFDGEKYINPELTLEELEKSVRENFKNQELKSKGKIKVKAKDIEKHIANLKKLNRWKGTLRWS